MSDQYTKHTTHTDALDTLGSIISEAEGRDAIHIAVYPVQAAERLACGEHVKLDDDGKASWVPVGKGLGIVDPFLTVAVAEGEWFWLLVYPRQITSLRHVWQHPSFPVGPEPEITVDPAVLADGVARVQSELWLRNWIAEADCPRFEVTIGAMLAQADGHYGDGEYVHFSGTDAHGEIPAEAWHHLGIYAGEDLSGDRPSYFSCSC